MTESHLADSARTSNDKVAYKVLTAEEWSNLATDNFKGSAIDRLDGFIHLSTATQLVETVKRYFHDQTGLVVAAVDLEALGGSVRWETSRHGQLFPHVYAELRARHVIACYPLERDATGAMRLPNTP